MDTVSNKRVDVIVCFMAYRILVGIQSEFQKDMDEVYNLILISFDIIIILPRVCYAFFSEVVAKTFICKEPCL